MDKPFCIAMAGPAGCSKTPVAFYLSQQLGLPIFSNDAIRTEVQEDTLQSDFDIPEYSNRRNDRLRDLLQPKRSFIYDASVDRRWSELEEELIKQGFRWFIISFDLSFEFWQKICKAKGYQATREQTDKWYADHQNFIEHYRDDIDLVINDSNFTKRTEIALSAVRGNLYK